MIKVVFWSQTGNTEAMANAVVEGIQAAGGQGEADDGEMEPFVEELCGSVSGKKIGLFGSYDWGDGEWMRLWEDRMKKAGAVLVSEPVICNLTPDDEGVAKCKALGEALAKA